MSVPENEAILRRLFWKLSFRGRALSRRRGSEGKLIKFNMTGVLVMHAFMGVFVCFLAFTADTLTFSTVLYGMTLFVVMFQMITSAGSVLFNKEEAEILLHRPVTPGELLRAKVQVLCAVSGLLALALNLPGMIAGIWLRDSHWWFPLAHLFSLLLMVVFSAGALVVVYQACLRWCGRERLDGMMTTMQTVLTILMVTASQSFRFLNGVNFSQYAHSWWVVFVPPAWFASLDAVLSAKQWNIRLLAPALFGFAATVFVSWLGFHRLAAAYGEGLMMLNDAGSTPDKTRRGRWLRRIVTLPPLSWWLHNPVERLSFLLAGAYLFRDRETKLRLYPSMAQVMILPVIFLFAPRTGASDGWEIAFAGMYLGWLPILAMQMLEFSEHWRAAEVFQVTPMGEWQSLFHGARKAGLALLAFPALLVMGLVVLIFKHADSKLLLLLPSLIALPAWSLVPGVLTPWLPLSKPFDGQSQNRRGCFVMIVVMGISAVLAGLAWFSMSRGWLLWFLLGETLVAALVYAGMHAKIATSRE